MLSCAYLSLLIFLLAILIPACDSSSPAFCMMYSAYKLNKQGDNIQPWWTLFSILNQSNVLRWSLMDFQAGLFKNSLREREVTQSCRTLCNTMDCSLPGSSVRGILQARTMEWVAISFSTLRVRVVSKSWRHKSRTQSPWQRAKLHRLRQILEIYRTSTSISWMRS